MDESLQEHLRQRNEVADVLRRAKALIDTPEKWTQGNFCGDHDSFCAWGAIFRAAASVNAQSPEPYNQMCKVVGQHLPNWNDATERTHAEVMAAFDRAIAESDA